MNRKQLKKAAGELQRRLIKCLFESCVEEGRLDPTKPEQELFKDFVKEARAIARAVRKHKRYTIDHRSSVLKRARKARKCAEWEWACVYYATYFEHWINWLIRIRFAEIGHLETHASLHVRMKPADKFALIPVTLGLISLPKRHLKAIQEITNLRNEFLHYKYGFEQMDSDESNNRREAACIKAERSILFLTRYVNVQIYKGRRAQINRWFSKRQYVPSIERLLKECFPPSPSAN